jgi:hypothetical protein
MERFRWFLKEFFEVHLKFIGFWFLMVFFVTTFPGWLLIWVIAGFPKDYWNWIFSLEFITKS